MRRVISSHSRGLGFGLFCIFFSFLNEVQNPCEGLVEDCRFQRVGDELAFFPGGDEAGAAEQIEVIGDAGGGDIEGGGDVRGGAIAELEHVQDASASGVLKGFELGIHVGEA